MSWLQTRFAKWKLTRRPLSSSLSMQARRTIFAQQNAKNYLNKGQNNMRVPHKNEKWCKQLGVVCFLVGDRVSEWHLEVVPCQVCRERSKLTGVVYSSGNWWN